MDAKQQAQAQVSGVVYMIRALDCDFDRPDEQAGKYADQDGARDAIHATPLSVEVRSGWHSVGEDAGDPREFRIVLCTGGPHVELTGDIGGTVRVVFRDWGDWGEYYPDADERSALDTFVSMLIGTD